MQRLVLATLLSALVFAAQAQTPAPAEAQAGLADTVVPAATPAGEAEADAAETATARDLNDRRCLTQTGSRISPRADSKGRKCTNAAGRAYSREDLNRTGTVDLAEALRRLDPAVH